MSWTRVMRLWAWCLAGVSGAMVPLAAAAATAGGELALAPCRLPEVEARALCGVLRRPLDPAAPNGVSIDLHVAVLPALARNKKPDPVFFFAGGPGQSAIDLAGQAGALLARLSNRRDLVLIDQRGTGRSAPLKCADDAPTKPLRELAREAGDPAVQAEQLKRCLERLRGLPHGDLRHYTTVLAMQDADAVRAALGAAHINLVGGSYGTRAALEYLRAFPGAVRRVVIDGVAPPDMVLPASFSPDAQGAFDALLGWCEHDAGCGRRYPRLRERWGTLVSSLPRSVTVPHPLTGQQDTLLLTHQLVVGMVRLALYSPTLASALPLAISEAAEGRLQPLIGLTGATATRGARRMAVAQGMHYSVICSEDMPLLERGAAAQERVGPDFGAGFAQAYQRVCAEWPRGAVPAVFYTLPAAPVATLLLSGGLDPVTPPRHGARVASALGPRARHVVVPQAGHGVMVLGCMRDVVFRFIDADTDDEALRVETGCAATIPRPPAFVPVLPVEAAR